MGLRAANTYTAFVNPRYTESERRQLGIAIIDYIIKRTKRGQGIGKRAFRNSAGKTKYSETYIETREFKIANKSKSKINLSLSGDMLNSIEVTDVSLVGRIVIGIPDDSENDKSVFMREKGYDFLGLTQDELNDIVRSFGPPGQEVTPANISSSFVQSFVRGLIGR